MIKYKVMSLSAFNTFFFVFKFRLSVKDNWALWQLNVEQKRVSAVWNFFNDKDFLIKFSFPLFWLIKNCIQFMKIIFLNRKVFKDRFKINLYKSLIISPGRQNIIYMIMKVNLSVNCSKLKSFLKSMTTFKKIYFIRVLVLK